MRIRDGKREEERCEVGGTNTPRSTSHLAYFLAQRQRDTQTHRLTHRQTDISYECTYLHLSTVSYGTLYLLLIGKDTAVSLGGAERTSLPSRGKERGRERDRKSVV